LNNLTPDKFKAPNIHNESPQQIKDSLRKQVQRNLKLINAIHRSTEGIDPENAAGPVLKVQRKQIAMTNRDRTMDERAKFYKKKEGRWAFYPKLEKGELIKEALAQRGISPEEIKMLH
jgi:hypothetical protein